MEDDFSMTSRISRKDIALDINFNQHRMEVDFSKTNAYQGHDFNTMLDSSKQVATGRKPPTLQCYQCYV